MTYALSDFNMQAKKAINKSFYGGVPAATITTNVAAIATSVKAETKTHDVTIEKYVTKTLHPGAAPDMWQMRVNLVVNKGFAGGLTATAMGNALTTLSAGPFPLL